MANGSHRTGNSDPLKIIDGAEAIPELDSQQLMRCYELHRDAIDMLGVMTDSFDPDGSETVTKFSDSLQTRDSSQPALMFEVTQILSANGAFFDDDIEDSIARDPLIIALREARDDGTNIKTLRLRRSLIAIACHRAMADCSGS